MSHTTLSGLFLALCLTTAGCGTSGQRASSNADLAALALSVGALDPGFDRSTHVYAVDVGALAASVALAPTAADKRATIRVDGMRVASGSPSSSIELPAGTTPLLIVVTAEDGTERTYTVVCTRGDTATGTYVKASNTEDRDYAGTSVAIDGSTLVVGAPGEDSSATDVDGSQGDNAASSAGAAFVYVRQGATWAQQAYLKASNSEADDGFGTTVAISGDTIVIGVPGEDSAATGVDGDQTDNSLERAGAAYVFVRHGTSWTQQAYLKAHNPDAEDWFGWDVAVDGETIVVGAVGEWGDSPGVNGPDNNVAEFAGAAYVFERDGSAWTQTAYLKYFDNPFGHDRFGESVAIDGDTIVSGARWADAAFVFVRDDGIWRTHAVLRPSDGDAGDAFGKSVGVSGSTIVIGASAESSGVPGDPMDNGALAAGAAYVFVRAGETWFQQAYLKALDLDVGDWFGHSVAISGETVIAGAIREDSRATGVNGNAADDSFSNTGAAYVFTRVDGLWSPHAYLKASNPNTEDRFGYSLAISGDTIVAGAPFEAGSATGVGGDDLDNGATHAGAAYVYE